MIQHGTIHALPELCRNASSLHDHSVRVTGALESYDPVAARARVGVDGESLWVDVSKVSGADPHRVGSLYQYIGELDAAVGGGPDPTEPKPVLRARASRAASTASTSSSITKPSRRATNFSIHPASSGVDVAGGETTIAPT